MPNHFHWMVYVKNKNSNDEQNERIKELNNNIGIILRSYTRAVNNRYGKIGSLFQAKTKAKNVNNDPTSDDNYALICFLYIHQNPLRAGIEKRLGKWKFSSYKDYAGLREGTLCNKALARELLGLPMDSKTFTTLSKKTIPEDIIDGIF